MIESIAILLSLIIFYQDMKERAVSWFLFPALAVSIFLLTIFKNNFEIILSNILFNLGFIALQIISLTLWISFKNKRFVNIFTNYFGVGDLLFFIAISSYFSPVNFVLFFVISLLSILVLWIFVSKRIRERNIPLAGLMSAVMTIVFVLNFAFPEICFQNDFQIINYIFNIYG